MDQLAYHPYPRRDTDPLSAGILWPNAGATNLYRVKQAVWDAFNGTAQKTVEDGLRVRLDEVGWQVGKCVGTMRTWRHSTTVQAASATFPSGRRLPTRVRSWAFTARAARMHASGRTSIASARAGDRCASRPSAAASKRT